MSAVPSVLLYSTFTNPKEGYPGYCASASPDWEGERTKDWPGRHGKVSAPFRDGLLRPQQADGDCGRGLFVGADVKKGQPICAAQPPLALHQYDDSRRVCEVCAFCGRFIGNLRSALTKPLEALREAKGGRTKLDLPAVEELVHDIADLQELEADEWTLSARTPCEHNCGAVFCSSECVARANVEGWHRVFCTDLEPERRQVWKKLRMHGIRHHEPLILAAQVVGEIVCLVKHHGANLWEAMSYFTRFAKMSWLNTVSLPSRSTTQVIPKKGQLAELAEAKRRKRYEVLTDAMDMLMVLLWERQFAELLTLDFYSNLVGQFSLSNVWVQLEHPLSERLRSRIGDAAFKRRFGKLIDASSRAAAALAPEQEEDWKKEKLDETKKPEGSSDPKQEKEVQTEAKGNPEDSWWLPRYEGTGLYVCVALANHSCMPSFTLGFADGGITTMVALRDLKQGDELNLAYVSPLYDLSERLTNLWRTWGFVCTCRRCQDQLMERVMARGSEVASLEDALAHDGAASSSSPGKPAVAPAVAGLSAVGVAAALAVSAARSHPISPCPSPSASRVSAAKLLEEASPRQHNFSLQSRDASLDALRAAQEVQSSDGDDDEDAEDEDEDEEEESEDEEAESSEEESDNEGGALAGLHPYTSPLGPRAPPQSVLALEADLKKLMQEMGDMED